jgi:hypothetical protein
MPAPGQGHDENPGLLRLASIEIGNVRPLPEIHLSGLSGLEGELDRGFDLRGLEGLQKTAHTGVGAGKAVIPDQGIINGSALDSLIEPLGNLVLVRLDL